MNESKTGREEVEQDVGDLCDEHGIEEVIEALESYLVHQERDAADFAEHGHVQRCRAARRLLNQARKILS